MLQKKEGKEEGTKEKKEKKETKENNPNHVSLFTLETERMVQGEEHCQLWRHTHTHTHTHTHMMCHRFGAHTSSIEVLYKKMFGQIRYFA